MNRLRRLREKLRDRIRRRDRQLRLFKRTGKRGHAKEAKRQARAVRYLRKLWKKWSTVDWISDQGLQAIIQWETGGTLPNDGKPYPDPMGYATIGYGHLIRRGPVHPGDFAKTWVKGQKLPGRLTPAEAKELLRQDMRDHFEPAVRGLFLDAGPLYNTYSPWLYDALVSFAYNLGAGAVLGAPGFETVGRAIRGGNPREIADALLLYDKSAGQALPGLTRRRQWERRLILTGDYSLDNI